MALPQHGADFYKHRYSYKRFIQKLWHDLLNVTSYEGTAATFHTLFRRQSLLRVLKWLTIGYLEYDSM